MMSILLSSIMGQLVILLEKSVAYTIGYKIGYFFALAWPFLLAGILVYLVSLFIRRRRKAKA